MYYSSKGQVVCEDKVGKYEEPKLLNDAIGKWPNYIRLALPILYIPIDKKGKSMSPAVQSTIPVQWLFAPLVYMSFYAVVHM